MNSISAASGMTGPLGRNALLITVSVVQDSRKRDANIVLETPCVAIRLSVELNRFAWRKSPATSTAVSYEKFIGIKNLWLFYKFMYFISFIYFKIPGVAVMLVGMLEKLWW